MAVWATLLLHRIWSQHLKDSRTVKMSNRLLTNVTPDTAAAILSWLGKHGKDIPVHIPLKTVKFARECFALIDTDKSGTLEPEELQQVFESLGQHVSLREAAALVESVAGRGAACLNFTEFAQMLNGALSGKGSGSEQALQQQLLQEAVNLGGKEEQDKQAAFNWADFHLLAKAFRRRKIVSGVINNEEGWREKVLAMAERQQAARKRLGSAAALNWRQRTADSSGRQSARPGSHQQRAQGRAAGLVEDAIRRSGRLGSEGVGGSLDGIVSAEATPRELLGPGVVVDDPEEQGRRRHAAPAKGASFPYTRDPYPQPARSRTDQPPASSSLAEGAAPSPGASSSPETAHCGSTATAGSPARAAAPAAMGAAGPCVSTRQHSAAALQAAFSRLSTRSYQSIVSMGAPAAPAPADAVPADLAAARDPEGAAASASNGGHGSSSSSGSGGGGGRGGLAGSSDEVSAGSAGARLPASPLGAARAASSRTGFVAAGSRLGRSAAAGSSCRLANGSMSLNLGRLSSSVSTAAGCTASASSAGAGGSAQVLAAAEGRLGAELVGVEEGSKEADSAAVTEGSLPLPPGLVPLPRRPSAALAQAAVPPLQPTTGAALRPHTPSVFPPDSLGPAPGLRGNIMETATAAALPHNEGAACSGVATAAAAGASTGPQQRHVPHYMLPLGCGTASTASAATGHGSCPLEPKHGSLEAAEATSSRHVLGSSLQGPGAGSWRSGAASMDAIAASYRLRQHLGPGTPATAAAGVEAQVAAGSGTLPAAAAAAHGSGAASASSAAEVGFKAQGSREGRSPRRVQGAAAVQSYLLEQVSAPAGHAVRRRAAAMQLIRQSKEQER